jgi:sugar phosphate isomerase/epimerase
MKLGLSIEPLRGVAVKQIIFAAKYLLRVNHLEYSIRILPFANNIAKHMNGLSSTIHLPIYDYDGFDLSSNNTKAERMIPRLISDINQKKDLLNLQYVLIHPSEDPYSENTQLMLERLQQINIPVLIENIKYQKDDEFMGFYFKAKDYLGSQLAGYALDAPHRYITDPVNWLTIPEVLIPEIAYIHISDCNKTNDLHKPLGLGSLPFDKFFDYLKQKLDYDGIIIQEIKPNPTEITSVMDSCLYCIKPFSKPRYLWLNILYSTIRPLVRWRTNLFLKEIQKRDMGLLTDLTYDYG